MALRTAIFDLDDTLVTTSAALARARRAVVALTFGGSGAHATDTALDVWQWANRFFGDEPSESLLRAMATATHRSPPDAEALAAAVDLYETELIAALRVHEDVLRAAERLKSHANAELALVCNGSLRRQWRKLRATGLTSLFPADRVVVCDGDAVPAKPDPAGLLIAARGHTENCVAVGDRRSDVLAARLAGIRVVRVAADDAARKTDKIWRADREGTMAECYDLVISLLH